MGLLDVLAQFGFDPKCKARLARHNDTRKDVDFEALVASGHFEEYQSWQAPPVFDNADFIVSFLGDGVGRARFRGVYRKTGRKEVSFENLPDRSRLWPWKQGRAHVFYELDWQPEYEVLVGNLVIEWKNPRTWVQHLRNYAVLECPSLLDIDLPTWSPQFVEGKAFTFLATSRERSREARDKCLEANGCKCFVCGMTFPESYGGLGSGFMHVHHKTGVASRAGEYRVDPVNDLQPVCPNCHAMIHWNTESPRTVEELRELWNGDGKSKER